MRRKSCSQILIKSYHLSQSDLQTIKKEVIHHANSQFIHADTATTSTPQEGMRRNVQRRAFSLAYRQQNPLHLYKNFYPGPPRSSFQPLLKIHSPKLAKQSTKTESQTVQQYRRAVSRLVSRFDRRDRRDRASGAVCSTCWQVQHERPKLFKQRKTR